MAPKGHLMMMHTMALIGFLFLGLAMLSLKLDAEIAPLIGAFFVFLSMMFFSMMRAEDLQTNAISRIRNTVIQMGCAPNEAEEITFEVVKILKTGVRAEVPDVAKGPILQLSDRISKPKWIEFSGAELLSVIKTVLDRRDRKKDQT